MAQSEFDISEHIHLLNPNGKNVLAIQGLNASVDDREFLLVPELVAFNLEDRLSYFPNPTPGAENGSGVIGFVDDVQIDVKRGFYDTPFEVAIESAFPGSNIRYNN